MRKEKAVLIHLQCTLDISQGTWVKNVFALYISWNICVDLSGIQLRPSYMASALNGAILHIYLAEI